MKSTYCPVYPKFSPGDSHPVEYANTVPHPAPTHLPQSSFNSLLRQS